MCLLFYVFQTFCPLREVPKILSHEGPLEGFQIKDKVRGVVLSVNAENEKIIISLQPWSQPAGNTKMKIVSTIKSW